MTHPTLADLQTSVQDKSVFGKLDDYLALGLAFLDLIQASRPTRIISPSHSNYIFYQYTQDYGHKITRPLNTDLFVESARNLQDEFERFVTFLADLKRYHAAVVSRRGYRQYLKSNAINQVIYSVQQAVGCIGDSFDNPNQSRKRVGQLFETLIKLILQQVGLECEPRTINIPIPNYPGYEMSYELDVVFSRKQAIVASETHLLHPAKVVGSVKTTSKDRIDKVFLGKYLLTKLLGRDVPVIAIFLHDVQRAQRGNSTFCASRYMTCNNS